MPATAELDRLVDRLHEDAEFRYAFTQTPEECLAGFDFADEEKELLAQRDQDLWFTYGFGTSPKNHCIICIIVVTGGDKKR